jgi:hypothetical protein
MQAEVHKQARPYNHGGLTPDKKLCAESWKAAKKQDVPAVAGPNASLCG